MSAAPSDGPAERSTGRATAAAFAALVVAAGLFVGTQAASIAESGGYSPVGPRSFPLLVAAALVLTGAANLVRTLRGTSGAAAAAGEAGAAAGPPHRAALVWLVVAMLAGAFLVERLGFVVAMAIAFVFASRAFTARASESIGRDALIALAVAVAVWLFFARVLGLRLPAGPWGF